MLKEGIKLLLIKYNFYKLKGKTTLVVLVQAFNI